MQPRRHEESLVREIILLVPSMLRLVKLTTSYISTAGFQLLKPFEIDRALPGRSDARDDDTKHEQRMGAADEDQFDADRIGHEHRGEVEQRCDQKRHREQRVCCNGT